MSTYFTQDHEWIEIDGDTGTVGITDYAQGQLGDITFVEMPQVGQSFARGDTVCVVDSVKAASDVFTPVGGEVTAINQALDDEPELVNTDAEKGGWLFRLRLSDPAEAQGLMDRAAYDTFIAGL